MDWEKRAPVRVAPAETTRVWRSPEAPVPEGILRWEIRGPGRKIDYVVLSTGPSVLIERTCEGNPVRHSMSRWILDDRIPGRLIDLREIWVEGKYRSDLRMTLLDSSRGIR